MTAGRNKATSDLPSNADLIVRGGNDTTERGIISEIESMLGGLLVGPVDGGGQLARCRRSAAMSETNLLIGDRVTREGSISVFFVVGMNHEAQTASLLPLDEGKILIERWERLRVSAMAIRVLCSSAAITRRSINESNGPESFGAAEASEFLVTDNPS